MNIGERIRGARLRAGYSLRSLAKQADVSAQAISKYERGMDMPGSGVLIRLSQALNVRVEYFFRPIDVNLSQPNYRRKASLNKGEQVTIQAQVQDWLERYLSIESIIENQKVFDMPAISRNINSIEEVEQVANNLRSAWNLGLDPIENLVEILEMQGIKVGVVPGVDDFDALTLFSNDTIPVIVVKDGVPGDRQRYSIAHELGHIILIPPQNWDSKNVEKAAHRFAGAFLAPGEAIINELGRHRQKLDPYELHLLKHKYGISMKALIHRAQDLQIISSPASVELYKLFSKNGWNRKEPGDSFPVETLNRMERLVLRALAEDVISEPRAAELLGQKLSEFWSQARAHHEGFPLAVGS
jgi:Zn-dependent peptidase ImmA (M78 family)/DNA-binding XRE family transcriptional regulator